MREECEGEWGVRYGVSGQLCHVRQVYIAVALVVHGRLWQDQWRLGIWCMQRPCTRAWTNTYTCSTGALSKGWEIRGVMVYGMGGQADGVPTAMIVKGGVDARSYKRTVPATCAWRAGVARLARFKVKAHDHFAEGNIHPYIHFWDCLGWLACAALAIGCLGSIKHFTTLYQLSANPFSDTHGLAQVGGGVVLALL